MSESARQLGVVALIGVTAVMWVMAPAAIRHQAGAEPLLYETVAIAGAERAGGAAWRAVVPAATDAASWGPRFVEVLEHGKPLARARPQVVRREGGGRYGVGTGGEILFAPSIPIAGDGPPPLSAYRIRRPRVVPEPLLSTLVAALAVLSLATALVVVRGLARSRVLGRLALWVPLGLAAWIAAALALESALPWTGSDLLGQKMAFFLDDADDYDAVFIGSSRIYRQLEPDTFDATFAAAGQPMRSFNLGVPDMRMLEVLFLTRWLLERRPEQLALLVVDAESDPLFIREENLGTARIVRWHDRRNFAAIVGEVRRTAPTRAAAIDRAARHLEPFVLHVTRLGHGLDRIRMLIAPPPPEAPPEQRGFFAGDEEMETTPSEAQRTELELFSGRLHGDLGRYYRDVERLARSRRSGSLTDPFELELFAELERLAVRAGVEVVFLIDPRPEETPNLVWAADQGVVRTLLRFDDPRRYPELYDPALRFDRHHVSKAGARLYTAEVARRIVEARGASR